MMLAIFAATFLNYFVLAFNILILIRVLMSWVPQAAESTMGRFIFDVTEPILAPIRRVLPNSQTFDFSPLVAYLLLQVLSMVANRLLAG